MSNNFVLITGASGGIGFELAHLFAKDNHNVLLIARNEQKLNDLANDLMKTYNIKAKVLSKDLSNPESPQQIYDYCENEKIDVEVLVNNAGFGSFGFFAETDINKELELIQVNITALTYLTKLFLPQMVNRKSGKILNVASTASFQPGPYLSNYSASKAYVLSLSEAIANEVEGTGVSVSVLCPGPTETGFQSAADMDHSKNFTGGKVMDVKSVAIAGYEGLQKGKTVIIPGLMNRIMATSVRFGPRKLIPKIVRRMVEPTK
ncbi:MULTISPECIES: SDR family oxidoreductase [Bacillaceae]|uniref:SDR family NAD(P)-dependent oxidoreductase n=1 Tax=Bacillaceae TaxID=186817 RepID=UPI002A1384E9|nr:SDR family oxidoreductase [Cytobacillus sp. IB215316]MDX8360466.1 SDR family oxidoreductase [Cytobacillus sp. IB215316]